MSYKCGLIISLIFFTFSSYAKAQEMNLWRMSHSRCSAVFGGGDAHLKKALENLEKLNPELVEQYIHTVENPNNLAALYIFIKSEAWKYMPNGYIPWKSKPELSETFLQHLKETYQKQYRTEEMSLEDFYVFYSNSLQSQYMSLARNIQHRFIESFLPPKPAKELKEFAIRLLDQTMPNFYLRELTPERAQSEFLKNLSEEINWKEMIGLADLLFKARQQEGFNERDWLENNPVFQEFTANQKRLFQNSLENRRNNEVCCMNTPGCLFCPNNRGFLRNQDNKN